METRFVVLCCCTLERYLTAMNVQLSQTGPCLSGVKIGNPGNGYEICGYTRQEQYAFFRRLSQ